MNKRLIILILFLCIGLTGMAQNDINKYKYLIVPVQFEFKKGKNPLKLSTLTRHLFNKEGFTTYYEGEELPDDLFKDRCLACYAEIIELKEGFRMTRLKILLKDCKDNIIFESGVGESGENNHEKRYHEALREAFNSIKSLNYKYEPEIEEIEMGVEQNNNVIAITEEPIASDKVLNEDKIKDTSHEDNESLTDSELSTDLKTKESYKSKKNGLSGNTDNLFYAREIENGYQLIDNTSNAVMVLLKTTKQKLFVVKGKDAIVYSENEKWIFCETTSTGLNTYTITIEF
ncbi:hypothetical protein ACPX19_08065 [Winogradskyella sp. HB-48]|uniref:hypothetical protein n=1 Tax=Winogradskyella sp. HB-48 TaxID=3416808 RepID=UPI003CFA24D6